VAGADPPFFVKLDEMTVSRRDFVWRCSSLAATSLVAGRRGWAKTSLADLAYRHAERVPLLDTDRVQPLVAAALDAARTAGATYADVRVTRTVSEQIICRETVRQAQVMDDEEHAIGVRALYNGRWGFASSGTWSQDAAARLGRAAAEQAHRNAVLGVRSVEWGHYPVATGSWIMPVGIDPFTVPYEEKIDFIDAWMEAMQHVTRNFVITHGHALSFRRQERTVGTTEGSYFTQTVYDSGAYLQTSIMPPSMRDDLTVRIRPEGLERQGAGWDALVAAKPIAQIPRLIDAATPLLRGKMRPLENGRYEAVLDAASAARLLGKTLGLATQLDRAMGYEANATGTSYLGPDPLAMLGTFAAGAPLLHVSANRSAPKGLATVRWDDEGITSTDFPLVADGIVRDYQTTREQAAWVAPWYERTQQPVRSHGCAGAVSALYPTMQCIPNLSLTASPGTAGIQDFIAGVKKGIALFDFNFETDFQAKNGYGSGVVREIVDGKIGDVLEHGWIQFSSVDVWKSLRAVGGAAHTTAVPMSYDKGMPSQSLSTSISAPPVVLSNVMMVSERGKF